jgi:pimeloyl-ACP methyl ester carboxylesterase
VTLALTTYALGDRVLHGAAGQDAGPAFVFLHGVTRRWQTFLPLVPALAPRWRLHLVDQRGHGVSPRAPDAGYRVVDYVGDAVSLICENLPTPVVLYGHSLGAMVAAAVAAEIPSKIRAIVLEDPPFHTMGARIARTPWQGYFQSVRPLAGSDRPVQEIARQLADVQMTDPNTGQSQRLGDTRDPAALLFAAQCLRQLDPRVLDPVIAGAWLDGYEPAAIFPRIQCPTLVLQADPAAGGALTTADAELMERSIPHCTAIRFEQSNHTLHWPRAQQVAHLVLNFVESLDEESLG